MKRFYRIFNEGSKINQIICAILINLPVFAYGASIGWMSPMTLLLQSKDSPKVVPLTDTEVSWMASVAYLTCIPGNILMAFLGDTIGRKKTLLFISATGAIILFHTTGNLFLYIIGDFLSYRTIIWICLALPTFHLVLFMMMPDSPSYFVKTGEVEEATRVLAWLRCKREDDITIKTELEVIKKEQINDEDSNRFLLKAIVKDKILSKAFYIAMMVTLAREICGAVPVLNFAGEIFTFASNNSDAMLSPNQQAMLLGAVQVTGSILASLVVEKAGRKALLSITSLISGLSMCALASWFVARDYGANTPNWLPIVTLCLCIFCDSSGLQPISIVIAGEIFSFKYRGTVMAVTMSAASLADFLQLLFFKPLANSIGIHVAFYFFGIVCILMALYVVIVIPETKGRSLEDIYKSLVTRRRILRNNLN
ncbi:facilitated trehalose transporter Tret1-like isoform X2 [Vanessa tameamea]|uniref:Facilitated trehalose transporter Tret1-like isoform X2 n=1 Tax=Vanessa tameamea TaxID=334116 RepID=A0ABM4AL62_VANTA